MNISLPEKVTLKLKPQRKKGAGYELARQEKKPYLCCLQRQMCKQPKESLSLHLPPGLLTRIFLFSWGEGYFLLPEHSLPFCIHQLTLTKLWLLLSHSLISQILNSPNTMNSQENKISTYKIFLKILHHEGFFREIEFLGIVYLK